MIKIKQGSSSTDEHTSGNPYMDFEAAQNGQIEVLSNDVSCPAPMTITIDGEDVEHSAANIIPTTDAGTYSLSKVDGNTVVWHNYVGEKLYQQNYWVTTGLTYSIDGNVVLLEKTTDNAFFYTRAYSSYANHKYYLSAELKPSTNDYVYVRLDSGAYNAHTIGTTWQRVSTIETATGSSNTFNIRWTATTTAQGLNVQVKNAICVDLTAMFGSGNEPSTVAEFEAMFPEDYYSYNESTLLPFKGQALKTTDSNDDVVDTLDINITTLKGTRADGTHEVMFPEGLKKAGSVYDEINYKTGKAIKRVGSRAYSSADSSDNTVITDGTVTYYALATPIEYTIDGFIQEPKRILTNTTDVRDVKEVYAGQDPVWYAYYGWDYNSSTHAMTRIGNTTWHKTLPIQSKMRRCAVKDDGTVKYISTWDYTKYEDGTTVDYTGGDGQIMVEIPEYYYEAYEETRDGVVHKILKLYPYAKIGKKSKKFYYSAFEGITDDASNSSTPKLYSISMLAGGTKDTNGAYLASQWQYETNAADYHGSGGDSNATSIKSNFGRPRTYLSETAFRTRATRRGTGWSQSYFTAYNSILRLYTVEYCNLNSQATYNPTLTANEYHQGGLGSGVTNANNSAWSSFNGYYPFIPCGVTKELGSNTGVIDVAYAANEFTTSAFTTHVPSYRGVENPFGHIWKWQDGYTKYGTGSTGNIYTCDDITKFSDSLTDDNVPDGYVLRGTCSLAEGWFGDWVWDSNGDFVHKTFASSESASPFHDYAYHLNTGNRALYSGGSAYTGSQAGLFFWSTYSDPSYVAAYFGGRLCYTPSEN